MKTTTKSTAKRKSYSLSWVTCAWAWALFYSASLLFYSLSIGAKTGFLGKLLASLSFDFFGVGAFILPIPIFYCGWGFLKNKLRPMFFRSSVATICMYISVVSIFSVSSWSFLLGVGSIGSFLSVGIINYFGLIGAFFLFFASFVVAFSLLLGTNNFYITHFFSLISKKEKTSSKKKTSRTSILYMNIFRSSNSKDKIMRGEVNSQSKKILEVFKSFKIEGALGKLILGPSVNTFEFLPEKGVRISKVQSLSEELALALSAKSVVVAPSVEGNAIGVQVAKKKVTPVLLGDLLSNVDFGDFKSPLTYAIGRDTSGDIVLEDLRKLPHLLIAGATGAGKSVAINSLLCSILLKSTLKDLKLLLIDPKKVELSLYNGIPHLMNPVVTENTLASESLIWAEEEMDQRFKLMEKAGVRNLDSLNEKILSGTSIEGAKDKLPYLVIVVDELADLILDKGSSCEKSIIRLAQKARASGIHLVVATQRPSVDVITGLIKANFPSRIAFQVASKYDSRTILDGSGAEKLLGQGDLLFMRPGLQIPRRVQGSFVTETEVSKFVTELSKN